jgi:hypothetical protein
MNGGSKRESFKVEVMMKESSLTGSKIELIIVII